MKGRYVIRLSVDDVGKRVSVRSRIAAAPGEPALSDTVGVLRSWQDGMLRIECRDGSVREIAEADVVAGRAVGQPPAKRRR